MQSKPKTPNDLSAAVSVQPVSSAVMQPASAEIRPAVFIFVGNLPAGTSSQSLHRWLQSTFQAQLPVGSVSVGDQKLYGFVNCSSSTAEAILSQVKAQNGPHQLGGSALRIEIQRTTPGCRGNEQGATAHGGKKVANPPPSSAAAHEGEGGDGKTQTTSKQRKLRRAGGSNERAPKSTLQLWQSSPHAHLMVPSYPLCREWKNTASCSFGRRCKFSHDAPGSGYCLGVEFFSFHDEYINLRHIDLGAVKLPLLESFSRGEFTRVKNLYLVIASACEMMVTPSHACYSGGKQNWR
jgi:hypothetical protein